MPGLRPPKEDLIKQLPLETERKVLRITIGFTLLASLILIIAIATDYWLILTGLYLRHGPSDAMVRCMGIALASAWLR